MPLNLDRRKEKLTGDDFRGGASASVVDGDGAPLVGSVGRGHLKVQKCMAVSTVVGGMLGDGGVERRRGRGGGGVRWSTLPAFQGCSSSEEFSGRSGGARGCPGGIEEG